MLFRQLEYFVALAREKHFARAAAACYVSQPALSEALRKLEHELTVSLVRRGHAFEGLTPEGERLVPWAQRILADHDALKQEAAAIQAGLTGQLRVGVVPSAATVAALLLEPFCTTHPLARVRLDTHLPSTEILGRLRRFELDAGIIHLDGVDLSQLTVDPLYAEEEVLLAPVALLGASRPADIGWAEAAALPLCLLDITMRGRQLLDEIIASHDIALTPQIETDSIAALFAQVATGRWATVVPHTWLHGLPPMAGTRVHHLREPAVRLGVGLVTNATDPGSPLALAFAATSRASRLDKLFRTVPGSGI